MPPLSITRSRDPVSRDPQPAASAAAAAAVPRWRKRRRVTPLNSSTPIPSCPSIRFYSVSRLSSRPMDSLTRRELLAALAGWGLAPRSLAAAQSRHDLTTLDAVDVVARVASRNMSAVELTDAYLARIESLDPALGAFVTVAAD